MRTGRRNREIRWGARALPLVLPCVLSTALAATSLARVAHAQPSEAAPAPAAPAETAPEPTASPTPAEAEPAAPSEAAATPQAAPSGTPADAPAAAPGGNSRQALLQAAVDKAERDQPSVVLPWIAAGVGVTTLLVGTAIAVITVATCDDSCRTGAAWPWVVITGCTLTSAGSAWLILALNDQAEARHRLERAREELERDRIDQAPRAAGTPTLSLRASF